MNTPHAANGITLGLQQQLNVKSIIKENFLKGCYVNPEDAAYTKLETERTAKMKEEIREVDNWDWSFIDETYEGVTLKHAYDMIG